jgi:hypothetical protein
VVAVSFHSRLRKESALAGSDRYSSGEASARPIRKSGRGATLRGPQGARTTHRGHTLTRDGRDRLAGMSPITAE